MKKNFALYFVISGFALLLTYMTYKLVSPEIYKSVDQSNRFGYIFVPDDDQWETQDHRLEFVLWSHDNSPIQEVSIYYKTKSDKSFKKDSFSQLIYKEKKKSTYFFYLPKLKKGKRYFYYLEALKEDGSKLTLKKQKKFFEKLLSSGDKQNFYVTFEGRVNRMALIIHIVMVVAAIFFLIHTLYFAIKYLVNGGSIHIKKSYTSALTGWLLFSIAVIPLGYYVAHETFGTGWGGWPFGKDITDDKSQITSLYWGLLLLFKSEWLFGKESKKHFISDKLFCYLIIVGIILTTIVYLIPHSIFIQQGV